MANNTVDVRSIGSILNGRNCFFVPCYQRGYRWNRKQVEDLLGDLYSFRKQMIANNSDEVGKFYCLQPVIVRKITAPEMRKEILGDDSADPETKLWELVDGQQRLTSIYILLSYLIMKHRRDESERSENDYSRVKLYNIMYESRPATCAALKALAQGKEIAPCDIDSTHISNALRYIDEWFNGKGLEINARYNGVGGESNAEMRKCMLEQITTTSDIGATKVIWYELSNAPDVDPVKEFTRINNGKIPLTDTELIKALFLQKKNFNVGNKVLEQAKVSLQWELMENTLQQNDFWCFISNKSIDEEDRMGQLLRLVYLKSHVQKQNDIEAGDIFRYYYNALDGLPSELLHVAIADSWRSITDTFNTLNDWYDTPEIYNYVGYLVQSGMDLSDIYSQFETLRQTNDDSSIDDFVSLLEQDIMKVLPRNCVETQDDGTLRITTQYPDRPNLRKILLLLNVDMLSRQLSEIRKNDESRIGEANVFKFPFGLYRSQEWDIEHIDSATTNDLTNKEVQKNWVEGNIKEYNIEVTDAMRKKMNNGEWADLVEIIQHQEGEESENKDFIGNLTLLDSATNRSYGNALFRQKRKEIIRLAKHGRYILPCTQYVFMKYFDEDSVAESRMRWTKDDKEMYHSFIIEQLKRFLQPPNNK